MRLERIAVLASGGGSNLQALIDACERKEICARIVNVTADRPCFALERAQKHGISANLIDRKSFADEAEFQAAVLKSVQDSGAQAVVLAGYLSIVDASFVYKYPNSIINIHPSLIPSFCGMGYYGERVHSAILARGCKISGATVHFVDEGADTGPIIAQRCVQVHDDDDAHSLAARVLEVEHELLPMAVALLCEGRLSVDGRIVRVN